ncbi:MAG: TonB-dependent receptor [Pseudomonadota bacterium]
MRAPPHPHRTARGGLAAALTLALAAPAAFAPGAAQAASAPDPAQDLTALPFEQLLTMEVYSASKFVQKANEAPSSVTVISAADIRSHGWRTLADVARSVRGLYVGYDRNYSYLGGRGFLRPGDYNTRFLLQVDGNRINDAVYDQAPLGAEFPLELDLIERIEFVPGPGSSIYGSNAFFGVINVITKKAGSGPGTGAAPATRVTLEAGSFGARRAGASTGWRSAGGTAVLLGASRHSSDGADLYYPEYDTPAENNGVASGRDHERGTRLFASVAHGALQAMLIHAERVKGVPTGAFLQPFNDPRSQTTDRQSYLSLAWRGAPGRHEELGTRLFWGSYDSFGDYVIDDAARTLNHDGSRARWWGAELKLESTRLAGHRLLFGLDYQRDYQLRQYNYDLAPRFEYLDQRRSGVRAGLYLQDQIALGERVLLNLGLRYDRNTGVAGVLSPRAALIAQLSRSTTLKAIYGRAYRAPNSYEQHYAFPGEGGQLPNPELRTERIGSSELALTHQFDPATRLTATAFRNVVTDLITQQLSGPDQMTRFENAGRVRARGMEFELERHWGGAASLRASYSRIRVGTGGAGGAADVNAPAHLAKFNLALPLGRSRWHAGLEAQYVARRGALDGEAAPYWLANANLFTATLWRRLEAAVSVSNLFDRAYADPAAIEHRQRAIAQDGRAVRVRLAYAF